MDVAGFYDDYVDRQVAVGINERHRAIMDWLRRSGLRPDHHVLEIGCGVGTLTELLAQSLGAGGYVVATDLSPKSIDVAKRRLAAFSNVRLAVADATELEFEDKFDVVVLADVIEHIPLEVHSSLFERIAGWLKPSGFALLNYPNPHHLEWCREHTPEVLQVIDLPIDANRLLAQAYPHGLYLDHLQTYSIWIREGDYVVAVFRPKAGTGTFTHLPEKSPTLIERIVRRGRRMVKW